MTPNYTVAAFVELLQSSLGRLWPISENFLCCAFCSSGNMCEVAQVNMSAMEIWGFPRYHTVCEQAAGLMTAAYWNWFNSRLSQLSQITSLSSPPQAWHGVSTKNHSFFTDLIRKCEINILALLSVESFFFFFGIKGFVPRNHFIFSQKNKCF